jgi:transposase-like protein
MMDERDRRNFLKRLRTPTLENPQKMKILKQIIDMCKKKTECPYCNATNGTVKKVGVMKIVHEKYRAKSKQDERVAFQETFKSAMSYMPEIRPHLNKAQDDLNPVRVMELFKAIDAEVCLGDWYALTASRTANCWGWILNTAVRSNSCGRKSQCRPCAFARRWPWIAATPEATRTI